MNIKSKTSVIKTIIASIIAIPIISLHSCTDIPVETTPTAKPSATFIVTKPAFTPTSDPDLYFVDGTLGDDENPGTKSQPWKSIARALQRISKGDSVIIRSGDYDERIDLKKSGITLVAEGIVHTRSFEVTGDHNLIRGFRIQDPDNNTGIRVSGNFNTIEDNEISNTLQDGLWFFGHDNTFRHNYIHDIWQGAGKTKDPHVDCFQTWSWEWDTYNVLFDGNICHNNRSSGSNQIAMLSGGDNRDLHDITFTNNVFIMEDYGYSPLAIFGEGVTKGIRIYNNTFYNVTEHGTPAIFLENVLYAQIINNVAIGYENIAEVSGTGNIINMNNAWSGDHRMVDYQRFDFHLLPDSPLIDSGFQLEILTDFEGTTRPQGNGYDIGAFEFINSQAGDIETNNSLRLPMR